MSTADPIDALVLQEFRLLDPASAAAAARILDASTPSGETAVPLLVSIDDACDVASVHAVRAGEPAGPDPKQRGALDRMVSVWQPPKRYSPRITERSATPPSYYRLAVTESGINKPQPPGVFPRELRQDGALTHLGLLWIGSPIGTDAGLFVLLGSFNNRNSARPRSSDWPRLLRRPLGVRIYDSPR